MDYQNSRSDNIKLFDNSFSSLKSSRENKISRIFKIILLSIFIVATFFLLAFFNETFFATKMFSDWGIADFLNFETLRNQQRNTMIIIRFSILAFVFFYSLARNFMNTYHQKEAIKKYWPWFTLYLALTIASFGLLFGFHDANPQSLLMLSFILIPLLLVNLGSSIYSYFLKRKTDPLLYKTSLIISQLSQIILIVSVISMLGIWINASTSTNLEELLFSNNSFYDFFANNVFGSSTFSSLIIIFTMTASLILLIIGANASKIAFMTFKANKQEYFKHRLVWLVSFLITIVLVIFRVVLIKIDNTGVLGYSLSRSIFLIEILFASIIFGLYVVFYFLRKTKTNSFVLNTIIYAFAQMMLWISLFITTLLSRQNPHINFINVVVVTIYSTIMLIFYYRRNSHYSFLASLMSTLSVATIAFSALIFACNHLLLSQNNLIFLTIDSNLYLTEIALIITVVVWITFLSSSLIALAMTSIKISQHKKSKDKTTNLTRS
ncbi:Uncharacterised protein [Metamycoplasma arthritidis]|uniref:Hypothetical membrane protein n=1 Tax=Metamycoplasma arthritidis (strain 158L3-1) TaxID=243272 RepID=B3PMA4_META1|nr:hypothetical protein [Metamycoplasma arthritidis]ACF07156.1 hypothetical membrane protein [Metamycoplasma arthritidis 158L3-1]VEU78681.1 Uncharacterised protein [Metamycoplasma arthritidis]